MSERIYGIAGRDVAEHVHSTRSTDTHRFRGRDHVTGLFFEMTYATSPNDRIHGFDAQKRVFTFEQIRRMLELRDHEAYGC